MITLAVNGAAGRMGLSIIRLAAVSKDFKLVLAADRADHPQSGKDVGLMAGLGKPLGVKLVPLSPGGEAAKRLQRDGALRSQPKPAFGKKADVAIDFSLPNGTMACLKSCLKHRIPLVIGTTGFDKSQLNQIRKASRTIPCFLSPNMSLGANLLFKLGAQAARTLGPDYDAEIIETHHRFKKDAPSGTAKRLSESVSEVSKKNIPIHSLRIGDVVGDHTVVFSNLGERIELTHRVNNRDIFARGAIYAAKFLAAAKPGLYSMADILA
ncbi:MAG: 4-hydroxy-tetrahydrodipicolinate reductase [Planctomycetota bacterium]